jgi:hypothetical protein
MRIPTWSLGMPRPRRTSGPPAGTRPRPRTKQYASRRCGLASERSLSRRQLLAAGSAAGLVAVLPRTVQADGSGDLVGSWEATVTATDPPLGEFASLMSFHPGGVFIESRRYYVPATPLGPLLETTGHGAWRKSSDGNFEVFFRFLLQEAPPSSGTPIGTDNIRLKL